MKKLSQNKPKFVAFIASSIDGKISLFDRKSPDWTSPEDWNFFQKSLKKFEAVVVGRNTYLAEPLRLSKRRTFVLTSQASKPERSGNVTFVNPAINNLEKLLSEFKTVAILGGGMAYRFALENGLMDEIFLTIEPLIFGRGKEMFSGGSITKYTELISVKKLNKKGTLLLHYKIKGIEPQSKPSTEGHT